MGRDFVSSGRAYQAGLHWDFVFCPRYHHEKGTCTRCDEETDQNGILVAYVEIDNWSTTPSFGSGDDYLFIQPDESYSVADGNEIVGNRIDCVKVGDSTVAVCLGVAVMAEVEEGNRMGIWMTNRPGEPSAHLMGLPYARARPATSGCRASVLPETPL